MAKGPGQKKDGYLDREEFRAFMINKAKQTNQPIKEDVIEEIFVEMDVNNDEKISI